MLEVFREGKFDWYGTFYRCWVVIDEHAANSRKVVL